MNFAYFLTQNARRHGERLGFIWGDRSWTWREIDTSVSALAAALAARGIVKGDRILVHSKNCDEMFWSMFAAFRLGAVWVPTNFRLMPDEVAYLAAASGARAFLCHGDFPDHAAAAQAASPAIAFTWRILRVGANILQANSAGALHRDVAPVFSHIGLRTALDGTAHILDRHVIQQNRFAAVSQRQFQFLE